jgi:hypothetical protein
VDDSEREGVEQRPVPVPGRGQLLVVGPDRDLGGDIGAEEQDAGHHPGVIADRLVQSVHEDPLWSSPPTPGPRRQLVPPGRLARVEYLAEEPHYFLTVEFGQCRRQRPPG